ncbi:MAG: imidazoleglycerol-phosphate dehydratase HisB [Planctomycetota bacterium]
MNGRTANVERSTNETVISVAVNLDGTGVGTIDTGIGFLDHMIVAMARHGRIDIELSCNGDLDVDDHHTAEDCALALGSAIDQALGERRGIARFGSVYAPMDEALGRAAIDLSGRPCPVVDLRLVRESIGAIACENITHFFQSLAISLRASMHIDVLRGSNDHHKAEAAFKATGMALRAAVARTGEDRIPSTKGVL